MKVVLGAVFFFLLSSFALAQAGKLPEILRPTLADESEALSLEVGVFKILPRGMFQTTFNDYKDENNPIGIREGGAFYSFTTGSHSYNQVPEVMFEQDSFSVGFAGMNYGFIADLGEAELAQVNRDTPSIQFAVTYVPPSFESEIRKEPQRLSHYESCGLLYTGRTLVIPGHTYVLRAIGFGRADKLVAFQVRRKDPDGSLVVFWKPIKDFKPPFALYQSDAELLRKLQAAIDENGYTDITLKVKDNVVFVEGSVPRGTINLFFKLVNSERSNGIHTSVREK